MIDHTLFKYVDEQLGGLKAGSRGAFSIVGLTATGKTDLALALAKYVLHESTLSSNFKRVDIISADSRQVFKAIPLVSGADVPSTFVSDQSSELPYPFYTNREKLSQEKVIYLHGIGILEATQEWSVSHFQTVAQQIMEYSWNHDGLVLLVGGTGLYHAHVFNEEMKLQPGPNFELRKQVEQLSVDELRELVKEKNPSRWQGMNESDRANPRRLIRVLESSVAGVESVVGDAGKAVTDQDSAQQAIKPDLYKIIMVQGDFEEISQKIAKRVHKRIELGAIGEVEELIAKLSDVSVSGGEDFESAVSRPTLLTATGIREIQNYLYEKMDLESATQAWIAREIKYAKQQLTWWKSHAVDFEVTPTNN